MTTGDPQNFSMGPDIPCPSCGNKAGWVHSDDHPESCYACKSCGEHYSRNRKSVYVPIGMTRDVAEALLAEGPFQRSKPEATLTQLVSDEVAKQLGNLTVFTGGVSRNELLQINSTLQEEKAKLEALLSEAVSRAEELSHAIRRLDAGDDDVQDRELKEIESLQAEVKQVTGERESAYQLLWELCDDINDVPRQGNLLERVRDARHLFKRIKEKKDWYVRIVELLYGKGIETQEDVVYGQVAELVHEAAKYRPKSRWFDEAWKVLGFSLSVEEYGKNFGRAAIDMIEEHARNASTRYGLIERLADYLNLDHWDDEEWVVQQILNRFADNEDQRGWALDNHRLDALDLLNAIEEQEPGLSEDTFAFIKVKLRLISDGKGRGGKQS